MVRKKVRFFAHKSPRSILLHPMANLKVRIGSQLKHLLPTEPSHNRNLLETTAEMITDEMDSKKVQFELTGSADAGRARKTTSKTCSST